MSNPGDTGPGTQDGHGPDVADIERAVFAEIEARGLVCERMACDPDFADTAAFCERYGIATEDSANAIVVASRKKNPRTYVACLLLADSRLDVNHTVCQLMGVKRASFASADETLAVTGQMIGGVTVLGWPAPLPLYVDARVMTRERIVIGGGSRRVKLLLAPSELEKLTHVQVVEGLAVPRDG